MMNDKKTLLKLISVLLMVGCVVVVWSMRRDDTRAVEQAAAEQAAAAQAIAAEQAQKEKAATEKAAQENDAPKLASEALARLGYPGQEVIATTYGRDGQGFLAMVRSDGYNYYVVDLRNNRATNFMPSESFRDIKKKLYSEHPMIIKFWLFNDVQDRDANVGTWQGSTHILPIYGAYKVQDGRVIPGMLTSGRGESPSHYQDPLYEQKNVDMMNIVMRQLVDLVDDAIARNVNII